MGKEIKVRIIMRWNTTEGWAILGPNSILEKGEIGLEYISDSALPKMKIGNGELSWDNLPYFETTLPKNFTWGNLRGTTLQTSSEITSNLELTKPGFLDVVNIVTLNKNFDKIDSYYNLKSEEIHNLGERITKLGNSLASTPSDYSELQVEIENARTINGITYDSLSNALDALNRDLQEYKIVVNEIIQDLIVPSSLELNEEGQIYLIDKKGSQIGNAITVKDMALKNKVDVIDSYNGLQDVLIQNNTSEIMNIKETIDSLPTLFPNDLVYEQNKLYLAVNGEKIEDSMVEIIGGGGGGLQTTYTATLTPIKSNISKPYGEKFEIQFTYSSVNPLDPLDNDGDGNGDIIINGIIRRNFLAKQGEINTLDITDLIPEGKTNVYVQITNSEGTIVKRLFTINATSLIFNFSNRKPFDFIEIENNNVIIPYTVFATETFTSYFLITKQDGQNISELKFTETREPNTVGSGLTSSQASFQIFSPGTYTLEAYVTSGTTSSQHLFLGIFVKDKIATNPYILMLPQRTTYKYGEAITFKYAIYDISNTPQAKFSILSVEENDEEKLFYSENLTLLDKTPQELTIQRYPAGNVIFRLEHISNGQLSGVSNSINYIISEPEIDLNINREEMGLIFEFDPIGKTNQKDAGIWKCLDNSTTPPTEKNITFEGINWDNLDGWLIKKDEEGNPLEDQTLLRLLPGASLTIPYYIFKDNFLDGAKYQGYSIEIELGTQNVTDYDALIIDTMGNNNEGLKIYSQRAELSAGDGSLTAQFKEDERVRLTFTLESNSANSLLSIYINGVLSQVTQYTTGEINQTPIIPIKIGAETSGIDVYFIRVYNKVLDEFQQLRSFCLDRATYLDKVDAINRNDIVNNTSTNLSKKITRTSIKGTIPYIIIECSPDYNRLPADKDNDKFPGTYIEFNDPFDRSRNFTAENCTISVQGTSSAGYPIKNFKIKLDKTKGLIDAQGRQLPGFYFRGEGKSQPTKVFCLKADYASSENANNVMLVDYYNDTCPYRTPPQVYEKEMIGIETTRHGIHGEPILLFWRDAITKEEYFQGKYNFNDDKDAENVFGYVNVLPEDYPYSIQCWEIRNNNQDLCLFRQNYAGGDPWTKTETVDGKTDEAWKLAFERRFPEQEDDVNPDLSALKRMSDWVASTNTNLALGETDKLPNPIFYKTLDTFYQQGTNYFKLQGQTYIPFSPKTGEEADAVISYSDSINVALTETGELLFSKRIRAIFEEKQFDINEMPFDVIFKRENINDTSWDVYFAKILYNENNEIIGIGEETFLETIEDTELSSKYGIIKSSKESDHAELITNFAVRFFSDPGWTPDLYEKHEANTKKYRLAKFKNEFENYFILDAMAYYYVFTETVLLMDNRAKNMFLVSYDILEEPIYDVVDGEEVITGYKQIQGHWAPTPYDMDSALGINNEGELKYTYSLEDTGIDGTVFTGQESVLWNNFRDCFGKEISEMYRTIRGNNSTELGKKNFSYQNLSEKMAKHQEVWPEVIWNIDQQIKYIQNIEENVLQMLQGNKRTQRDFWLYNAFKYRDSKYSTGDATEKNILLRLNNKGTFKITPYSDIYARVKFGNALDIKKRAKKNELIQFPTDGISSVYDLETNIYSADRISSIGDLSDFQIGLCNFNSADKLEEIILGRRDENYRNEHLTSFSVGSSTVLSKINISNCPNLTQGIDVSTCPLLETFLAKGSGIRGVSFAKSSRITTCHLPSSVNSLKLQDLHSLNRPKTEKEEQMGILDWGLEIETNEKGKYNLEGILIENSEYVPSYDLIMNSDSDKLSIVRITGLEWHITKEEFEDLYLKIKDLKGYNQYGSMSDHSILAGKIYFPEGTTIDSSKLREYKERFEDLTFYINEVPQYIYSFIKADGSLLCSYIVASKEDIIDPTFLPAGEKEDEYKPILGDDRTVLDFRTALKIEDYNYDNLVEGEKNTRKVFIGWENLPTDVILLSGPIIPKYQIFYLVKFFNENQTEKLFEDQWILEGGTIEDPLAETVPTKEPSAEFSYTYAGWSESLSNITHPTNFSITFSEKINTYLVKFISGEKELTDYEQYVDYGKSPIIPPTEIVYKYFKNLDNDDYSYYEIYDHMGWDIYNDGDIEIDFENDDNNGIVIRPREYTTEPINIHAVFSSIEPITDNWETIIENCNNGSYKTKYPVGTQKEVKFTYRNQDYNGILEVVEHNKDILAEDGTTKASLTFILKDIFTVVTFRNNQDFIWNGIKGPLAGGWTVHDTIYPGIKNIVFKDVIENDKSDVLNSNIKEVLKKTDFGPAKTNPETKEYYPTSDLAERIWTPSASEMGVLPATNTEIEAQQGETYIWFTTNDSRKKGYNGEEERYWTRTWEGTAFRFYGVAKDGGYAYDISLTTPTIGILSFESAGLIFGLCI